MNKLGVEIEDDFANHLTRVSYKGKVVEIDFKRIADDTIAKVSGELIQQHRAEQLEKILKEENEKN